MLFEAGGRQGTLREREVLPSYQKGGPGRAASFLSHQGTTAHVQNTVQALRGIPGASVCNAGVRKSDDSTPKGRTARNTHSEHGSSA